MRHTCYNAELALKSTATDHSRITAREQATLHPVTTDQGLEVPQETWHEVQPNTMLEIKPDTRLEVQRGPWSVGHHGIE